MIPNVPHNPFLMLLGAELLEWDSGMCVWGLDVKPEFLNTQSALHGGVVATLLDVACAYSCFCPSGGKLTYRASTISLTTHYLFPIKGRRVIAQGRHVGGGTRIQFAEAELLEDGVVVAKASGNFRIYPALLDGIISNTSIP